MCRFVHDTISMAPARILSFNAAHLRMIAASRKKTDKRDAYWVAKCLQTGLMPHPVHVPTEDVRRLRGLLVQRAALVAERKRWVMRARAHLLGQGIRVPKGMRQIARLLDAALAHPEGLDVHVADAVELCARQQGQLCAELERLDTLLHAETQRIEAVRRLMTIPAVGEQTALTIYAQVGDVRRFRSARLLCSYAGLVPSVHQSGETNRSGAITKAGSPGLRAVLVQAGHVLLWRCQADHTLPLKKLAERVHTARGRRKIAVVAAARHILRIAFYVLRDGVPYDPARIRVAESTSKEGAAA
jgi:transposase